MKKEHLNNIIEYPVPSAWLICLAFITLLNYVSTSSTKTFFSSIKKKYETLTNMGRLFDNDYSID